MIINIHVPRSGGTSLSMLLVENFPMKSSVDTHGRSLRDVVQDWEAAEAEGRKIYWLSGHFEYGLHRYLPMGLATPKYITLVRDPVDFLISLYFYSKKHENTPYYSETNAMNIMDWLNKSNRPRDSFTYMYSGYFSKRGYDAAVHNLFHEFTFFGITDLYEQSVDALVRVLGLRKRIVHRLNEGGDSDAEFSKDEVRAVVAKTDSQDAALYAAARAEFLRRYGEGG